MKIFVVEFHGLNRDFSDVELVRTGYYKKLDKARKKAQKWLDKSRANQTRVYPVEVR